MQEPQANKSTTSTPNLTGLEIAVIGMAGRFPGAGDLEEFWDILKTGKETAVFFCHEELERAGVGTQLIEDPNYLKVKPVLQGKDCFDESFFGYSPREAEVLAPHMRIFYECAWRALEDSGYDPAAYNGLIGCYAGSASSFGWQLFSIVSGKTGDMDELAASLLSDKDTLSSRMAYKLDLKGPCFTLHTACSTSLVAIHLACRGLLTGECGIALAGGTAVTISGKPGYLYREGMIHSADGHNRSFDARATGTVFGEGVGIVVLKRYRDAIDDGDHIYALVKGSAINNDGILRVGYTAPGTLGQREVVKKALKVARVTPESITYVEAHGTATALGDPMEIEALNQAFNTDKRHYCALGAVKTNVGHLDIAAGVTGFIKTVLALKHRLIPPTLHFETPNPKIDFENSPFYVNTELLEWKNKNGPLRAGVSAFGLGGTNAHVILEEVPDQGRGVGSPPGPSREYQLILLSAKTPIALDRMTKNLVDHFKKNLLNHGHQKNPGNHGQNPDPDLADAAYTLQVGRRAFHYRRMSVCSNLAGAAQILENSNTGAVSTFSTKEENHPPPVVFMFPGLGSQYLNMGRELYEKEPYFRKEIDRCFEILNSLLDYDIKEILYPPSGLNRSGSDNRSTRSDRSYNTYQSYINRVEIAQPLVFIFEYALARLMMHWGITPLAVIGYSFGEYAAACVSGVFSLAEGLKLVAARGELIAKTPKGAMLNVPLPKKELMPLLPPQLSLAIDNDISCLVAGPEEAVDAFENQMKEKKYICLRLSTTTAVHSPTMEPILEELTGKVREITLHAPSIPFISNVSGTWITAGQALDPGYWSTHLRQTVRFAEGIKTLAAKEKSALFLEIGPGRDISTLILRYIKDNPKQRVINLIRHPQQELSDVYFLLNKIGGLWLAGITPDWSGFYENEQRQRISLPGYSFENHRYQAEGEPFALGMKLFQRDSLVKKSDTADWFYQPSWKRLSPVPGKIAAREAPGGGEQEQCWLIFTAPGSDVPEPVSDLVKGLKQREGSRVVTAAAGTEFARIDEHNYVICPADARHYRKLFAELHRSGIVPRKILHLWGVTPLNPGTGEMHGNNVSMAGPGVGSLDRAQELGFYSLLYLAQALGKQNFSGTCEINVLTDNMQEVVREVYLCPEKITVLAAINVIPQEYPGISCRSIDLDLSVSRREKPDRDRLPDQLLTELDRPVSDTIIAFRGNHRWVRSYEPIRLKGDDLIPLRLKKQGVYLITGGLGGIGMILAENLFKHMGAKLVLTGRSPQGRRIRELRQLKEQGAEILVMEADAADEKQMRAAVDRAEERFGKINGVIHAAGIVGGNMIQTIDTVNKTHCQQQFQAKIYGLLVLERVLRDKNLDFCLLMSSISSVLGGLGYLAYSAANLFMDGFVHYHNRYSPVPWISVNWDEWQVEKREPSQSGGGIGASLARLAMDPEQGFEVFKRVLSWQDAQQVVISTGSLEIRTRQWIQLEAVKAAIEEENRQQPVSKTSRQPRPNLLTPYVEPQTPVEKNMAEILQKMFGYEKIGTQDDLFELGIDSIKLIQVRARMNKRGYTAEMADFFQYPTISKLAPLVRKVDSAAGPDQAAVPGSTSVTTAPTRDKQLTPGDLTYKELDPGILEGLKEQYRIEDIYPLGPMQEGMLFHSLYERENTPIYFEQLSHRLHGGLDIPLMEKSLHELVKRHDVLRTVFIHEGVNRPLQIVLKEQRVEFYYKDLRGMSVETGREKETFVREFKERDRRRSFNLSKDVLIRVAVIQAEDNRYEIIWSYPHILLDGWCLGILMTEFFEIYGSYIENRPHRLAAAKPFRTYIQWLESLDKEKMKRYWQAYLEGYEEAAGIPGKKSVRTFDEEYRPAAAAAVLEEQGVRGLQQIAVQNKVTLNTLFQAVWGILLGKYSGKAEADVVFAGLVSGRPPQIRDVENMVGCFINVVPVRIRFNDKTKFNDLLREVQNNAIHSEPYHYSSLAEIQSQSPLKQNLLDHIFEFQNFPLERQMEDVESKIRLNEKQTTVNRDNPLGLSDAEIFELGNYDLSVVIIPRDRLMVSIGYNANVYDREIVENAGFHSLRIIDQVLGNDQVTMGQITLLSEPEKHQILLTFNDHAADFSRDKSICRLMEKTAAVTPRRIALVEAGEKTGFVHSISYQELNRQVNELSKVLLAAGVNRDNLVGILMARSRSMVIAILAVWKAGAAYIPIDRQYPVQRTMEILTDSGAGVLMVSSSPVALELQEAYPGKIISLDGQRKNRVPGIDDPGDIGKNTNLSMDMNSLAYVIYTSGSTGRPKGAMVEHLGMMNHIQAKIDDLRLTAESIVVQNATHTFDISIWQFFTALTLGGKTLIYPDELVMDPQEFKSRLGKDRVTILEVVPSYLSILLDTGKENFSPDGTLPLSLDYLLVTGEEVQSTLVEKWFRRYPGIKMVNAYGPTEASDDITHHIMDRTPRRDRVPIGKPLQNLYIYIVDHRGQLCPIGVKGEIWVAGVGVGRGYLNNPELTSDKFKIKNYKLKIKNESGALRANLNACGENKKVPGSNNYRSNRSSKSYIYQTGDLGAWLPDGTIDFLGRKDYQVKVRGFRIEPGEIENRLMQHPTVRETVVIDRDDGAGNKYLCAYVVPHSPSALPSSPAASVDLLELKVYLSASLPDYMVPAYILPLERLPLTSHGKVDRKALPVPEINPAGEYAAPRNEIEEELVKIWAGVLGRDLSRAPIGIDDNFFQLGGHSLKAMIVMSGIHQALEVKVPLAEIFRLQTIRELYRYIQRAVRDEYAAIEPVEKQEYYPVSSAQNRLYLFQQLEPGNVVYNMFSSVVLDMELEREKLSRIAAHLIRRHESLRTSFHLLGGKPVQRVHPAEAVSFELEYHDLAAGETGANSIITGFVRPFALDRAPLLRVGLIKLATTGCVLMADMHHIITDGLSMAVFINEAVSLYQGQQLPLLRLRYKDFVQWQQVLRQQKNSTLEKQRQYWLDQFKGGLPVLKLPTDYPRSGVQRFEGDRLNYILGPRETLKLRELAASAQATLYHVLVAILNILLSKLSGQEDIILGIGTAGRWSPELQNIIGMFVNTLVLRNYPTAEKSFSRFLQEVKEKTLAAFDNQDYPFEDLVARLLPKRDRSRNPLFDIIFAFNNLNDPNAAGTASPDSSLPLPPAPAPGIPQSEPTRENEENNPINPGVTKFDLSIVADESAHSLSFLFEYSTALFKKETIRRFINYFQEIVSAVIENKDILLQDIAISYNLLDARLNVARQEFEDFEF